MVATQTKVDLSTERPAFFKASRKPALVELPEASYLVTDGEGAPGGERFQAQMSALFSIAYAVKFALKKDGLDFKMPTVEASWWIDTDGSEQPPQEWRWQLRIMVPDFVTESAVQAARHSQAEKKRLDMSSVRLERQTQGQCVQIMHVGPYDAEAPTIEMMRDFTRANGLEAVGPHDEVYLSDPNRGKPERIKTILRQRVRAASPGLHS